MTTINKPSVSRSAHSAGFTLMELAATIAIIAILAVIAYPSYLNQIIKSKRAVAASVLLDIANRQEQYFFDNGVYADAVNKLAGYTKFSSVILFDQSGVPTTNTSDAVYAVSVAAYNNVNCDNASSNPVCFKIQAIPWNSQGSDACGIFTITSSYARNVSNTTGTPASACW